MTVQALLLWRHLAKGLPRPRDQEHRVVAEARFAPPPRHDLALTLAIEELGGMTRIGERERAHEAGVPRLRFVLEPFQELGRALRLCWPKSRRPDARKASKRLDLH